MTEYVLRSEGSIWRRDIAEREVDVSDALVKSLTTNSVARLANIFEAQNHKVINLALCGSTAYYTVPITELQIRAPWHPIQGGILVPNFSSKSDPLMTVKWTAPAEMTLRILISSMCYQVNTRYFNGMWLFAFDSKGVSWRLPLPNLHDDCSVCTGIADSPDIYHNNDHALVGRVMEIFETSRYNADLWKNSEVTQRMFRVKPGEKDSFTVLPPDLDARKDWISLCLKVANAVTKYIVT